MSSCPPPCWGRRESGGSRWSRRHVTPRAHRTRASFCQITVQRELCDSGRIIPRACSHVSASTAPLRICICICICICACATRPELREDATVFSESRVTGGRVRLCVLRSRVFVFTRTHTHTHTQTRARNTQSARARLFLTHARAQI